MAVVIRRRGVIGAVALVLSLGLAACTGMAIEDPLPTSSGGPPETPEPQVSPEVTEDGDWVVPEGDDSWPEGWEKAVPQGITFPAQTDPNYEFSEQPQSRAEQWLYDHWPEVWEQGIRAVSDTSMTEGLMQGDPSTPAALVQYIGGERAEGTEEIPLGFRGQATDIHEYPTDVFPHMVEIYKDLNAPATGPLGSGGYRVFIHELFGKRGEVATTRLYISGVADGTAGVDAGGGRYRNFDTWEDAWAFVEENGFIPNTDGARPLYRGEISSVVVMKELPIKPGERGTTQTELLNPVTGEFEVVSKN